ncbi:uncharacterized protein B4U80_02837 [Leptotrombidium deliense]|uniref:Nanos-type domain-containing protein n=1 Tax=Leptotrombidium deliense TaxID=299467 RepID=A0A443S5A8_9ACAR|nr:uncharacterized protein B4U80_02837 [Leptotrombidium deliense]
MNSYRPVLGRGAHQVYNASPANFDQFTMHTYMYVPSVPANSVWSGKLGVNNSQNEANIAKESQQPSVLTLSSNLTVIEKEANANVNLKKSGKGKSRTNLNKYLKKVKENMDRPKTIYCVLCKSNGETEQVYKSHSLRNCKGQISCPILRVYNCPLCNNGGGDFAHTIRFCPENVGEKHVECLISKIKQSRNAMGLFKNN